MGRRSDIDWEAIEKDYRLGQISIAAVAEKHGVALSGLKGKAKVLGWARDLTPVVKAATKAAITKERADYAKELAERAPDIGREIGRKVAEAANSGLDQDVAAAAALGTMRNRVHATLADEILLAGKSLLNEIRALSGGDPASMQSLLEAVGQNDPASAKLLAKAISLPERARTLDTIASAVSKAVAVDRKANNLDSAEELPADPPPNRNPIEIARRIAHALSIGLRAKAAEDALLPALPGIAQQRAHWPGTGRFGQP